MNRIKELRTERNWTQTDLAVQLSSVKSTVSRYESETAKLDPSTIRRLCAIFCCTADYLLGFSERREPELTDADVDLLSAYHAADDHTRELVDLALRPFLKKKESAAG